MRKWEDVTGGPGHHSDFDDARSWRDAMYVTVRLRPDAAAAGNSSGLPADLAAEAEGLGLRILPMHPGVDDEQLGRYFYAELDDPDRAEEVATRLGRIPSVDGAYVKPPEGPP
jgi:hypothetical protein